MPLSSTKYLIFMNLSSTTKLLSIQRWQQAVKAELDSMELNNTWTLVLLPKGKHTIRCRWVYKVKTNPDGSLDKHKAPLVAKGYTQQDGIDFTETFSFVAKLTTLRVLLALSAINDWQLI